MRLLKATQVVVGLALTVQVKDDQRGAFDIIYPLVSLLPLLIWLCRAVDEAARSWVEIEMAWADLSRTTVDVWLQITGRLVPAPYFSG